MSEPASNSAPEPNPVPRETSSSPTTLAELQERLHSHPPLIRRLRHALFGEVTFRDSIVALLLTAIITLLMARVSLREIPQPQPGEIAPTDYVLPESVRLESAGRTTSTAMESARLEIPKGTMLLRQGQPVSESAVAALHVLRELQGRRRQPRYLVGLYMATLVFAYFVWRYVEQRQNAAMSPQRQFLLMGSACAGLLLLVKILLFTFEVISQHFVAPPFNNPLSSKFAIPFATGAMLVTLVLDAHRAMIYSIVFSLCVGYMSGSPLLAIYALASSLASIYAIRPYRDRNAILKAGGMVGLSNFIAVSAFSLIGERITDWPTLLLDLGHTLIGGFFVAAAVSLLLPLYEYVFDICTDVRLLELSNLNLPILRQLAAQAPGTYHHSILVGILAEAAAESVGCNALLARVACLYHDIGKMVKPKYYVENTKEAPSHHDQLAPQMSSLVIIDHVKEGLQLAKQIRLPQRVADLIPQHHGTSVVTYFFHKAKNGVEAEEIGITEDQFRYPGPRPRSKEAGLVMLADSIEAAARTVENPTPRKMQNVVERITGRFINDHQLDECPLTLAEIHTAKQAFTQALVGIYHQRLSYPGYDFNQPVAETSVS